MLTTERDESLLSSKMALRQRYISSVAFFIVAACSVILLTGCGRKSNPKAPENFAPGAVQFLAATATKESVDLTWSMPLQTAGGEALKADSVVGFIVRRGEVIPETKTKLEDIGEVVIVEPKVSGAPVISERDDAGNLKPVGSGLLGGEKKQELTNRVFRYSDKGIVPGKRYNYQVIGVNADDVEGLAPKTLRVTFNGVDSKVETITKIDTALGDDSAFSY